MATYHIHEGSYELPPEWRDESVIIHSIGEPRGPARYSVVMNRVRPNEGEDLFDFAERQLADLRRSLPGFSLAEQRQLEVDGALALEADYTWTSDRGVLDQRQVYLPAGEVILVVTASALGKIPDAQRAELAALFASFRFRRGDSA